MSALLLLLWACSNGKDSDTSETEDNPCFTEAPSITIGDGAATFVPLEEGAPLTMTHGPQGGWHMLASVLVAHTEPIVTLHYTIDVEATETRISDNQYRVLLKDEGDCKGTYWNMYGYLDVSALATPDGTTPPELICGSTVRLTMEAADTSGHTTSTDISVVAAADVSDTCGPQ